MDPPVPALKISIVGAGIAGLSTALAHRRAGHLVTVYERSSLLREVGAAMHVPPNAARALLAWGLDPVQARFVTVRYAWRGDPDLQDGDEDNDGRAIFAHGEDQISRDVIAGIETRYGAPWYLAHRVDFHEELRRLATETEGSGTPAVVHTCSHVIAYVSLLASASATLGVRNGVWIRRQACTRY
jgi:salicylate hydroxylase